MKIALVAPSFIAVPPADYGGTELFVAHLAEGLAKAGVDVTVYANGESTVNVERRWIYEKSQWPIKVPEGAWLRELNHHSWALHDAIHNCDVIHVQSAQALVFSRFLYCGTVLTLHGPHEDHLSELYSFYPDVHYVCISEAQCAAEKMPKIRAIHHGIEGKAQAKDLRQLMNALPGFSRKDDGIAVTTKMSRDAHVPQLPA